MGDIFGGGTTAPAQTNGDWFGYGGPSPAAPQVAAPSWTSGLGNSLGKLGGQALPFGLLMASNYIQGNQAKKNMQQTSQANQQTWQQNAFPNSALVNAQSTQNRGEIGQARLGAYQNLASNLASRGWGSGSGLMAQGGRGIESGYLQSLGKNATEMTKLKNTPMFGMPSAAYQTPVSGGTEQALGGLDTALGYYMIQNMLKGG